MMGNQSDVRDSRIQRFLLSVLGVGFSLVATFYTIEMVIFRLPFLNVTIIPQESVAEHVPKKIAEQCSALPTKSQPRECYNQSSSFSL